MKIISSKKKKLKGMTLVEIIVSLAVLSSLTVILVGVSSLIDAYTKSANKVNGKVAVQAPIAEAHQTTKSYKIDSSDNKIRITFNGNVVYEGNGYSTVDPSEAATAPNNELGGNLGLKYIKDMQYTTVSAESPSPGT